MSRKSFARVSALTLLPLVSAIAQAQTTPPQDIPYASGTVAIAVDATDLAQRIIKVKQTLPVQAGPMTLLFPQWLPGNHAPSGPIDKLAGLKITGNGQPIAWKRDPLNVFAFQLDVPAGVQSITTEYQYLTPTDSAQGRVVMTPNMLNLQ